MGLNNKLFYPNQTAIKQLLLACVVLFYAQRITKSRLLFASDGVSIVLLGNSPVFQDSGGEWWFQLLFCWVFFLVVQVLLGIFCLYRIRMFIIYIKM